MMPADEFQISPGPHMWRGLSVNKVMYLVILATLLPAGAAIYYFGIRAVLVIATSVVFAVITEFLSKRLRNKPFVMDGSAVLTGILLALTLPPTIDLWMVALGAIFAIGIVKEAFGGLGQNIFNPALGARAFMAASFGKAMTTWVMPFAADGVTTATPLAPGFVWSTRLAARLVLYKDMFLGNRAGSLGETSVVVLLVGAAILLAFRLIDWRIPLTYIGVVVALSALVGEDPLLQVMAGGLLLTAFYMATDYVTSPVTHRGRIIFGIGCGIVTFIIRHFGSLPEGVGYAILFMNSFTPMIDRLVKIRPYGFKKAVKNAA